MDIGLAGQPDTGRPRRRVREEVLGGFAVMAVSAAASSALALAVLVLARLAG